MSYTPATGGTGGDFSISDPVNSFVNTSVAVATRPSAFFHSVRRTGDFAAPLLFALICALINAVIGGLVRLPGRETLGGYIASLILTPIGTAIGLAIATLIAHLLVMVVIGAGNAGPEATFRVAAYGSVTSLLSWIPWVGLLVFIYSIYLWVVGIREVHSTTTEKALVVVLVPLVIGGLIFGCLAATVGLTFLAVNSR
ncbi:MAG: YIP1 family protein [Chloroflexota bacterium]|nr:YIP1 family protein [Chloroflexota bacterium]